ncbi:GPR endopeptidase [Lacrimispora sp. 210928-DFI.3.58]|uniref:GPR endopeptidase n=1 Tax=Lacrimispora sp. 210928-DFI.3.58 TaxID=2883214 RepID=UPI001D085477|nr:GPR endopeptidase [Lacrimispora sp. 210928-DFI.3.58]MCB7320809.1 GPR endopeptidase [Lacrimispora sp. 210928-DFI.3.58]
MENEEKDMKKRSGFQVRTDLALEEKESFEGDGGEISGVALREWFHEDSQVKLTEVRILNEEGAASMGKPKGTYLTLEADRLSKEDEDYHSRISDELAHQIGRLMRRMLENAGKAGAAAGAGNTDKSASAPASILVVGLGNSSVTPDSLGPRVLGNLQVTRHLEGQLGPGFLKNRNLPSLSGIAPGVMAQTGMETAEILKGIIHETQPDIVIAIDALAARSVRRLGTTIQLTDTGIHPGSGVGNHRHSLTRESLGIPVLAIGVPTVVGAAAIVHDTVSALIGVLSGNETTKGTGSWIADMDSEDQYQLIRELLEPEFGPMYVTPPDIDQSVKQLSFTISEGIHRAVFPQKG